MIKIIKNNEYYNFYSNSKRIAVVKYIEYVKKFAITYFINKMKQEKYDTLQEVENRINEVENNQKIKIKNTIKLNRVKVYPIDFILPLIITENVKGKPHWNKMKINLDGYDVKINSIRLQTFKLKGTICNNCGIEGKFFALEKPFNSNNISHHLNLYGYTKLGQEILMTSDHIIPKSKNGPNGLNNRQCLCSKCNEKKGNK